jgi:hypothetical protein
MLHAMAALMLSSNELVPLSSEQEDQHYAHDQNQQLADWATQEQQQICRRRLMMQEDIVLSGGPGNDISHDAVIQAEVQAQQHATDMEQRLQVFMHST